MSGRWGVAFALGATAGLLGVAATRPPWLLQRWAGLRLGSDPSREGLTLRVSEAPAELAGEGPGPWLLVELRNEGPRPVTLHLCRPPGEELLVSGTGPDGAPLPRPPFDPERPTPARPISRVDLPPGGRIAGRLDLSERLLLPAQGRCTIRVERLGFPGLDQVGATSGELVLPGR